MGTVDTINATASHETFGSDQKVKPIKLENEKVDDDQERQSYATGGFKESVTTPPERVKPSS